jgi:very-short-patch-repair endonuclease
MKLHYQHNLKTLARKLRKTSTLGEVLLWAELKQNKLGYRFLRQVPIDKYIVDFYCHRLRLAIEIDGATTHDQKAEQDKQRQKEIEACGVVVMRFSENNVRDNLSGVIVATRDEILRRVSATPPFLKED